MDRKSFNIMILGISFMLVFSSFQTCGMIQQTVLDSIGGFGGAGFISLAIIYMVFAVANWIAPLVISLITEKWSMVLGGLLYSVFIAVFFYPYLWSLYIGSVLIGFAAAITWTGQGTCLTLNSDSNTIARNSGFFWTMLQFGLFLGNVYVFFEFQDKVEIDAQTRYKVFTVLLAVAIVGVLVMLLLKTTDTQSVIEKDKVIETKSPMRSIVRSFELLFTKRMGMLTMNNFYSGLGFGLLSSVYGTCIGRTNSFGTWSKQLVGLNGIFIGLGEVIGGAIFGLLGKKTNKMGRDPIMILGYIAQIVSYYIIFINIPADAVFHSTDRPAYIKSSMYLAMLCSFLLGFADSCFSTQMFSIIASLYPNDSANAFALFKFTQALAAAISFSYSASLELQWQLLILVIFGTIGTLLYCRVEWDAYAEQKPNAVAVSED